MSNSEQFYSTPHPFDRELVVVCDQYQDNTLETITRDMTQAIMTFLDTAAVGAERTFVFVNNNRRQGAMALVCNELSDKNYITSESALPAWLHIQLLDLVRQCINHNGRKAKILWTTPANRLFLQSIPHDSYVYLAEPLAIDAEWARYLCDNMASVLPTAAIANAAWFFYDIDPVPKLPIVIEWREYLERRNEHFCRSHAPVLADVALALVALDLPVLLTLEIAEWLRAANHVFGRYKPETKRWQVAQLVKDRAHAIGAFVYED